MGRIIRRVLSRTGPAAEAVTVISLGALSPVPSSGLPEDSAGRVIILCLALLRTRFTWPPVSPRAPVVSYTTLSPLPDPASRFGRSALCCTFSRVAPGGRYPPSSPAEPGRSSVRSPLARRRHATVSPTHSGIQSTPPRRLNVQSLSRYSSTRIRIAPVPGQNTISSGAVARISLSSAGASAMLLASDTLPRSLAAPTPTRARSSS